MHKNDIMLIFLALRAKFTAEETRVLQFSIYHDNHIIILFSS